MGYKYNPFTGDFDRVDASSDIPEEYANQYITDSGTAVPASHVINFLGNSSQGISSSGSGNTVIYTVANATTSTKGVASFNPLDFTVTSGNVSLANQPIESISTDIFGPVSPTSLGVINFSGATNIYSDGSVANTVRLNLQGTNHALFVGRGTNTPSANLSVGSTNTVLLGNTGADPSFGQVPNAALVNSSITFNNGNNITWTGSPVSLGGNITANLTGTTNHAVQIGNASGSLTSISLGTNGQVLIGATGADPAFATLTSSDSSITFTPGANSLSLQVTGGTTTGKTITGNTGGARAPTGGNWNIVTSNATAVLSGVSSTLTIDFNITNLVLGSSLPSLTSGTANVGVGNGVLAAITSGGANTVIGSSAGISLTTGTNNVLIGAGTGTSLTSSTQSTAVGTGALLGFTTGSGNTGRNTVYGYGCYGSLSTGVANIGMGYMTGQAYTGAESSNILFGNTGVLGESNVIRIGTQGTSQGQQSQCYLAGVLNTVSGRVVKLTTPGAYPYTTLTTDYVILMNTSSARTINLIASPVTGTTYRIKDNTGSAGTNNITVSGNGNNIDGSASYTISMNYDSIDLVYNGTQWNIL
jgi:hypothetical protein